MVAEISILSIRSVRTLLAVVALILSSLQIPGLSRKGHAKKRAGGKGRRGRPGRAEVSSPRITALGRFFAGVQADKNRLHSGY
jgi:hypothetical protein